jgi:hypothetical protein
VIRGHDKTLTVGVSVCLYDNDTFTVESFLDEPAEVTIIAGEGISVLHDLETGEALFAAPDMGAQ